MKWHSAPVLPGQPLSQCADTMKFQSDLKLTQEARLAAARVEAKPTHSDSSNFPTSGHLTELCHELVISEWKKGQSLLVQRSVDFKEQQKWMVAADKTDEETMRKRLHPVWKRVRVVKRDEVGRLSCSCGNFQRCG